MVFKGKNMKYPESNYEEWRDEGVLVLKKFFSSDELVKIQDDFRNLYGESPTSLSHYHGNHPGSDSDRSKQFEFIHTLPFNASVELNLLSLHPKLISLSEELLGSDNVVLYQSHTWAKFSGRANYNQALHCDFNNHTLTVPSTEARSGSVNYLIYLSDVTEGDGPFCYVSKKDSNEILGHRCLAVDKTNYSALIQKEKMVVAPAGTVIAYTLDTFHRGTDLIESDSYRYSMSISYKSNENNSIGFHVWQVTPARNWSLIMNNASPSQLSCLGIPKPGSRFWNATTIKQTKERWPQWKSDPYIESI